MTLNSIGLIPIFIQRYTPSVLRVEGKGLTHATRGIPDFVRRSASAEKIRKLSVIEHNEHELNCAGSFVQIAKPLLRELLASRAC